MPVVCLKNGAASSFHLPRVSTARSSTCAAISGPSAGLPFDASKRSRSERHAALAPAGRATSSCRRRTRYLRDELGLGPRVRADAERHRDADRRVDAEALALVLPSPAASIIVTSPPLVRRRSSTLTVRRRRSRDRRRRARPTGSPCGTARSRAPSPPVRSADRSSRLFWSASAGSVNLRERRSR